MLFVSKQAIALLLMGIALAPIDVGAQTISPANAGLETPATKPTRSPAELTGKERLGEKWKDEQSGLVCSDGRPHAGTSFLIRDAPREPDHHRLRGLRAAAE
jgi:hypothetical protein